LIQSLILLTLKQVDSLQLSQYIGGNRGICIHHGKREVLQLEWRAKHQ
jgi:hypothetical protein